MRPRRPGHFTSVAITLVLAAGIMAPHPAAGAQAQSGAQAKLSDQDRDGKLAPELEALAASANSAETVRRSEEHTSELQSLRHLVCRLLLEKKKKIRL